MYADISFQQVNKITASAFLDLASTPLMIRFQSTYNDKAGFHYSRAQFVLHLENKSLAEALVEAINRVVAEHDVKLPTFQEALQDAAKARTLFDASKGGCVKGITEDHRFALANVFQTKAA